jgi:hypothetical protein
VTRRFARNGTAQLDGLRTGLEPGIHDAIPAEQYHADPTPEPSLSASIAHVLCARSPLHAWTEHPRLNAAYVPTVSQSFDLGSAVHAYLLTGEDACQIVAAKNWQTKAAKTVAAEARANGRIPVLPEQWTRVFEMAHAIQRQLDSFDVQPRPLTDGKPEQTIVWEDHGIWCRSRLDWLHDTYEAVDDLKTTSASAHPQDWTRRMYDHGADVQARFYVRGIKALTGHEPAFRFITAETTPPYAISVNDLAPSAQALADEKVDYAIAEWAECLESGRWPGYPPRVASAEMPGWEEERWVQAREADGYLERTTTELQL